MVFAIDWFSFFLGFISLIFGIYTWIARKKTPEKFPKLQAMQEQFGTKKGFNIHFVFYSLVPVVLGMVWIIGSMRFSA
jgi:hypothetical protein